MGLDAWPAVVDDDGSGQTGTVLNLAFTNAVKASIENDVTSAVNPAVKAKTITDEVVAARGTKASLDARLDVALNEDGTPKAVAGQATEAQVVSFATGNWIHDDDFLIWHAGDAAAPAGWTLAGVGATIARCGTGLADANTKIGPFCAKVTRAAADATLSQSLLNATSYAASGACLVGRKIAFGAWVRCGTANMARLRVYEGVAGVDTVTTYHSGVVGWEFLSAVHTVTAGASELTLVCEVKNSGGDAYFSGATALPGQIALTNWVPCPKVYGVIVLKKGGTLASGAANLDRFVPARPFLVKDTQLSAGVAPTGQAIIVDINVWDGAAWQSMYATKPQIAATATEGAAQPDGTYRYRCFTGTSGTTITNAILGWNIDQVGSVIAGSDLLVMVRALQYTRPQENMLAYNDF